MDCVTTGRMTMRVHQWSGFVSLDVARQEIGNRVSLRAPLHGQVDDDLYGMIQILYSTSDVARIILYQVSALVQERLSSYIRPSSLGNTLFFSQNQRKFHIMTRKPFLAGGPSSLVLHRNGHQQTETPVSCRHQERWACGPNAKCGQ